MAEAPAGAAAGRSGPRRARRRGRGPAPGAAADQPQTRPSPDGKSEVFIQNYNVYIRPVAAATSGGGGRQAGPGGANSQAIPLSFDGSEGNFYVLPGVGGGRGGGGAAGGVVTNSPWSPDSKKIAIYRRRPGYNRLVTYVQSSPSDQLQPKTSTMYYQKPGDVVDFDQPVLFDVASKKQIDRGRRAVPESVRNGRIEWSGTAARSPSSTTSAATRCTASSRSMRRPGQARAVIEETSKTFIDYNRSRWRFQDPAARIATTSPTASEIIWMSERDGWAHLYLYDGATGQVKNQITKGNWQVHFVDRVDEQARQI